MKKNKWLLFLSIFLVALLCVCLVACSGGGSSEEEEEDNPTGPQQKVLTTNQSLDKVYNGLLAGGEAMKNAKAYGVSTEYTMYTRPSSGGFGMLNYTIVYKANYQERAADSEVYIHVFDNNNHKTRLSVFYDGKDLYLVSAEDKVVISNFSSTMMFSVFLEACKKMDMTPFFFSDQLGAMFNRNSAVNLSLIVNVNNTSYRYAGQNNEIVEYTGLDVTILNENVNNGMMNIFRGIGDKFDPISNRYLGFSINRLAETRFNTISGDLIQTRLTDEVANRMVWEISGRLQDTSYYQVFADVGYNDGQTILSERTNFVKSTFTEASLSKNRFLGTALLPTFSDVEYDAELVTNISTQDNLANELSLIFSDAVGTEFVSMYYRTGKAYLNASGINDWLDGTIDLDALNLPKVYFPGVDVSKFLGAAFSNVVGSMLDAIQKDGNGIAMDEEMYDAVMENFHNDGKSYIYYLFTERWYHKVTGDEEPIIEKVARVAEVDVSLIAAVLGEDFFLDAELELGYDLDSGVISVILREKKKDIAILHLMRDTYRGVSFPADVYEGTSTYARLKEPEVITMDFEAEFAVRNGKTSTDLSKILGALVGDPSGINTQNLLRNTEVLIAEGAISETFYINAEGKIIPTNNVMISLYKRGNSDTIRTPVAVIRTNENDRNEILVSYYATMGDYNAADNEDGLHYRIKKDVIKESFDEILGKNNIFSEFNVLTIFEKILTVEGISQVSKINGWFNFSLVVSGAQDPVKELIGLENTTATVKTRIEFNGIDVEVDFNRFVQPSITPLDNIVINSVYDASSAWKDNVEVIINNKILHFVPNYDEETITVVTGKTAYHPTAKLFGKEVTYEVLVTDAEGTYRISRLYDPVIILDPTETTRLPDKIQVVYDNGQRGYLRCTIEDFAESNITLAGYNLPGFADEFDLCTPSKLIIGVDSIMNVTFDVYILVQNRKIIPEKEKGKELSDGYGVPVVATIYVDPYTYAMRLRDDPTYDPVVDGLRRAGSQLLFESVYKQEEVAEEDTIVVRDVGYDVIGYNRFLLADLDLTWDYDQTRITWQGSSGYAYATFGAYGGEMLDIAVRVVVSAQTVDHIVIDDEDNNVYTIDFLQRATYTIPTQSNSQHTIKMYFKGADSTQSKYRYVSLSRPDGLTDDEYHDRYIAVTLNWDGIAQTIAANPYVITASRNERVFCSATFGSALKVGVQTIQLTVEIPDRTQDTTANDPRHVATSCAIDSSGDPIFDYDNVTPSRAFFAYPDSVALSQGYDVIDVSPYDSAFRLPGSVYLEVPKVSGYRSITTIKQYEVQWVTTNEQGEELNLIEEKQGGGFGLKHPVTAETEMTVYGKVGDRGNEPNNDRNAGSVWIVMIIRNEESQLRSIQYTGLEDWETSIYDIDPYAEYTLPDGFVAVLESGKRIERYGVEWEARVGTEGNYTWYYVNQAMNPDAPAEYYSNGKFLFDCAGGVSAIRYIIEGESDSIRQTLSLDVFVNRRTIVSDSVDLYAEEGTQPKKGYSDIDVYEESSTILYERLQEIERGLNVAGVAFAETGDNGIYTPAYLSVDWKRAEEGEEGYEHSLDYLLKLMISADEIQDLLSVNPEGSMTLYGTILTGTINEQELRVKFYFLDRKIAGLVISRIAYAQEQDAARIGTITEGTATVQTFGSDEERNENRRVTLASLGNPAILNIRLDKPFALTCPNEAGQEKYASPTQFFEYVLGQIGITFTGSAAMKQVTPTFRYDVTVEAFDRSVLEPDGVYSMVAFRLTKLSKGSAIDPLIVRVYTLRDTRLNDAGAITPELYDETGTELYSENKPYQLPTYIEVAYENSGIVRYDVPEWTVEGAATAALFSSTGKTTEIAAKLINVIRDKDTELQARYYNFAYVLPCVDVTYRLTVYIAKKDIRKTYYHASGETSLYNIENGTLTIDNPYLYYDPEERYGFDVTKVPTVITPYSNDYDFLATEVTSYTVSWQFIEGVFTPDAFRSGREKELLATAILHAYYAVDGTEYVQQTQTVELYLTLNALNFTAIEHSGMTVVTREESAIKDVIEIDPYNDVNGYAGRFEMPVNNLTVRFDGESYVFNNVEYYLVGGTGASQHQYASRITTVEYDEKGHKLSRDAFPDLRADGVLEFNMYLPGFGLTYDEEGHKVYDSDGAIRIYVNVLSKVIETAYIPNTVYASTGYANKVSVPDGLGGTTTEVETVYLPSLYYIDPYNAATYALPHTVRARFLGEETESELSISGWAWYNDQTGTYTDFGSTTDEPFYMRASAGDSTIRYGFFTPNVTAYKGNIYTNVYGYISMGRSVTGEITKQTFKVTVIVLNRSLKATYRTSYRYDDPFGGLLSDIGGQMNEDMFVSYPKYYEEYFEENGIDPAYKYDSFASPLVPTLDWSVYNDDSIITPTGNFDKDIVGNAYFGATHRNNDYVAVKAQQEARYELLVQVQLWDAYFTAAGNPLAYYSATTTANLINLKERLEKEILYATYKRLVKEMSESSDETKRQYANYMTNGLANEIIAAYNYSVESQMEEIVVEMYALLKREYEASSSERSAIYALWKEVYDEFVAEGSTTDANLSDCQILKAKYYALANDTSSSAFSGPEKTSINAPLRKAIEAKTTWYKEANIFDVMFDYASTAEQELMTLLLREAENTDRVIEGVELNVILKSVALTLYMNSPRTSIGSVGESAYAHISAPALQLSDLFDLSDESVLSEYLFNLYSEDPFMSEIGVGFIKNYGNIFLPYIEQGLLDAIREYSEQNGVKGQALTTFVEERIKKYVNDVIPYVTVENSGGQQQPLIEGFSYEIYNSYTSDSKRDFWQALYNYWDGQADLYLSAYPESENPADYVTYWDSAYRSHQLRGETEVIAFMDNTLAGLEGSGAYTSSAMVHRAAFDAYAVYIRERYLAELLPYYEEAVVMSKATVVNHIFDEDPTLINELQNAGYGSAAGVFSTMYSYIDDGQGGAHNLLAEAYELLRASLTSGEQGQLNTYYHNNFNNEGMTMYYVLRTPEVPRNISLHAQYVYLWKLGSSAAWDELYEKPEVAGYTKQMLDVALEASQCYGESLYPGNYNVGIGGAFTEELYADFVKSALFERIVLATTNVTYRKALEAMRNRAINGTKSKAFDSLYNYVLEREDQGTADLLITKRDQLGNDAGNLYAYSFDLYVASKVAIGEVHRSAYGAIVEEYKTRAVFDRAVETVAYLKDDSTVFGYKAKLSPTDAKVAELKGEAIEYYLMTYATAREHEIIESEWCRHESATETYDALLLRADVSDGLKNALRNAYATVLLNDTVESIRTEISDLTVDEMELDPVYTSISNNYTNFYLPIVSDGMVLGDDSPGLIQQVKITEYIKTTLATRIEKYTTYVNDIRSAIDNAAKAYAYGVVYEGGEEYAAFLESVFRQYADEREEEVARATITNDETYSEILDDVLERAYVGSSALRNKETYNNLYARFVQDTLENYNEAVAQVTETKSKSAFYDELNVFSPANGVTASAESVLPAAFNGLYNEYDDVQKETLNGLFGITNVLSSDVRSIPATIGLIYREGIDMVFGESVADLAYDFLDGMNTMARNYLASMSVSAGDAALVEGIRASVVEIAYRAGSVDPRIFDVAAAVALSEIVTALYDGSEGIERNYLTNENLAGDFSSVGEDYKASYVTVLMNILVSGGYLSAYGYVSDEVARFVEAQKTDADLIERVEAAIIEKLLLSSDGIAIREIFESELDNFNTTIADSIDYLARARMYGVLGGYRMLSGDGNELFETFKAIYNDDLTDDDRTVIARYFDATVFTNVYPDADRRYGAFLTEYANLFVNVSPADTAAIGRWTTYLGTAAESYLSTFFDATADAPASLMTTAILNQEFFDSVERATTLAMAMAKVVSLRSILTAYESAENLAGDFTSTSEQYDAAYANNLLGVLESYQLTGAKAVMSELIVGYGEEINADETTHATIIGMVRTALRSVYSAEFADKLVEKFDAGETDLVQLLQSGCAIVYLGSVNGGGFLGQKGNEVTNWLAPYGEVSGGSSEEGYQAIFDKMCADAAREIVSFKTGVYTTLQDLDLGSSYFASKLGRYGIIFDAIGLTQSTNNTVYGTLYILNAYKMDDDKEQRDNQVFKFGVINPIAVDFYDTTEFVNGNVVTKQGMENRSNTLIIDPLAPELPVTVHAFGKRNGNEDAFDLGIVSVEYSDLFYQNIYSGQAQNDTDYVISLIDSRGNRYPVTIAVTYLDDTIEQIAVTDGFNYGGSDTGDGYYTLYDLSDNKNHIRIDPINEDIIDTENRTYVLPSELKVTYKTLKTESNAAKQATLYNVEWDTSVIRYTLGGQENVRIRPTGYTFEVDGVEYQVIFDYTGAGSITVRGNGNEITMLNAPSYDIFNLYLSLEDQTVTNLYVRNEERELSVYGTYDEEQGFIDVPANIHSINPFDIQYPSKLVLEFLGGEQKDYQIKDWRLEPGAQGVAKMGDIIQGKAYDYHVVAVFTYLSYTIRVRFVVDEIQVEAIEKDTSGEWVYIDGGTIYLVAGGGSAAQQLARNYSYLYYNFGVAGGKDFRKVALSFTDAALSNVSTASENTYKNILGVLGWDKTAYPNLGLHNNISFTIIVVNPLLVPEYELKDADGNVVSHTYNRYVRIDYASVPYDNNFQRANYSEEPTGTIPDNFLYFTESGYYTFAIDKGATQYDILGKTATYRCIFYLNSTSVRIAADSDGGKAKEFTVTVPIDTYLHTEVTQMEFVKTPVQDNFGNDIWTWVGDDSEDAILWQLGRQMTASDLPRLTYINDEGEAVEVKPLWNLNDLNVNRATGDEGYPISCFYYDKNGTWKEMVLVVYINKVDVYNDIVLHTGGSQSILYVYDAKYHRLPLELSEVLVLRDDGGYLALSENAVDIRYKREGAADREYSKTDFPIDAGVYFVRVLVDDYNVMLGSELYFTITIEPRQILATAITFADTENGIIEYTYDGQEKPLVVESGLPTVVVDNWFNSIEEKNQLVRDQYNLNPGATAIHAKAEAYRVLFERVPRGAQAAMEKMVNEMKISLLRTHASVDNEEVLATVFDSLLPGLTIIEVIPTVVYTKDKEQIGSVPTDVGSYTAVFTIDKSLNYGNYELIRQNQISTEDVRITAQITIKKEELEYSIASNRLVYCGKPQNPLVSGLHDENGNLPAGVSVVYAYTQNTAQGTRYINSETAGGITDVGTYRCTTYIYGGNNYPDAELDTIDVYIDAKTLYIRLDEAGSDYLGDVADLKKYLVYDGLVGNDTSDVFGSVVVKTEVENFFTIGEYEYELDGFKISPTKNYTYTYVEEEVVIDGVTYNRLALKQIVEGEESLYYYQNSDNSYVYATLIAKFGNYDVLVQKTGKYVISVAGGTGAVAVSVNVETEDELTAALRNEAGPGIRLEVLASEGMTGNLVDFVYDRLSITGIGMVVVSQTQAGQAVRLGSVRSVNGQKVKVYEVETDEELAAAIAGATSGTRVEIYLKGAVDGSGNLIERVFDPVTMDVSGSVAIYGCYDRNKAIITYLKGITVVDGALDLRIVGFRTYADATVCVDIGERADDVRINEDCRFYGYHTDDSGSTPVIVYDKNNVGIRTDNNYRGSLTVADCTFVGFRRAIESVNGNLRTEQNAFVDNYTALSVESTSGNVIIHANSFAGNDIGIVVRNGNAEIRYNSFVRNRFGVVVEDSIAMIDELTEEVLVQRNDNEADGYVFDNSNVVKVTTGSAWAAAQSGQ